MKDILLSYESIIKKYININNLEKWIELNEGNDMFGQKLWMLYSLEIWLRYIKNHYFKILF